MNKLEAIAIAKRFRKDADELLQRMKEHKRQICPLAYMDADDIWEVIAQHRQSIRDLESCIMRQGMVLKYIGNPDPYPESKNPDNAPSVPPAEQPKDQES